MMDVFRESGIRTDSMDIVVLEQRSHHRVAYHHRGYAESLQFQRCKPGCDEKTGVFLTLKNIYLDPW